MTHADSAYAAFRLAMIQRILAGMPLADVADLLELEAIERFTQIEWEEIAHWRSIAPNP